MSGLIGYFRAFVASPSGETTQIATTTTATTTTNKSSDNNDENEPLNDDPLIDYDDDSLDNYHTSLSTVTFPPQRQGLTLQNNNIEQQQNEKNDDDRLLNMNERYENNSDNSNSSINNNDPNPQDSENDLTPPDPPPPPLSPPTSPPTRTSLPPPPAQYLLMPLTRIIPSPSSQAISRSLFQPPHKFKIRLMTQLRRTDRMNHWSTKTTTNDGSRIYSENDGPLSHYYNEVVSLELCSYDEEETEETEEPTFIKLYLYDEYARGWSALKELSERPRRDVTMIPKTPFCVSFRHIPERCVLESDAGGGIVGIGIGGEKTRGSMEMDDFNSYDDELLKIYWHDKRYRGYQMGWKGAVTEIDRWFDDDNNDDTDNVDGEDSACTDNDDDNNADTQKFDSNDSAYTDKDDDNNVDSENVDSEDSALTDKDKDSNVDTENVDDDDSAYTDKDDDNNADTQNFDDENSAYTDNDDDQRAVAKELLYDGSATNRWEEGNEELEFKKLSELSEIITSITPTSSPSSKKKQFYFYNTIGLIVGFGQPNLTKSHDWMMSLSIIDQSLLPYNHTSVIMNIFAKEKENLPLICEMGDIIVCHRVKIQKFQGELQIYNNKDNSSFLTIHTPHPPQLTLHTIPRQKTYTLSPRTTHLIHTLHTWGHQTRLLLHPTMNNNQRFTIAHMGRPEDDGEHDKVKGDVTVCVTGILEFRGRRQGKDPYGFLRVWDGTGPSVVDRHPIYKTLIEGDDPSSTVVQKIADIVELYNKNKNNNNANQQQQSRQQHPNFDPPTHLMGRVVNVAIWEEPMWRFVTGQRRISAAPSRGTTFLTRGDDARTTTIAAAAAASDRDEYHGHSTVHVGRFVRLRNVNDGILRPIAEERDNSNGNNAGIRLRCLMVHSKSWITPLLPTSHDIIDRLFDHHRRMQINGEPLNLQSGLLPLPPSPSRRRREDDNEGGDNDNDATTTPQLQSPTTPIIIRRKSYTNEELTSLAECLGEVVTTPPTSFWVRFSIGGVYPSIDAVVDQFIAWRRGQRQKDGEPSRKERRRRRSRGAKRRKVVRDDDGNGTQEMVEQQEDSHEDDEEEENEEGDGGRRTTSQTSACRFLLAVFDHTADLSILVTNDVANRLLLSSSLSSESSSSSFSSPSSPDKKDGNDNNDHDDDLRNRAKKSLEELLRRKGVWECRMRSERANNVKYFVLERLLWEEREEGGGRKVTYVV